MLHSVYVFRPSFHIDVKMILDVLTTSPLSLRCEKSQFPSGKAVEKPFLKAVSRDALIKEKLTRKYHFNYHLCSLMRETKS